MVGSSHCASGNAVVVGIGRYLHDAADQGGAGQNINVLFVEEILESGGEVVKITVIGQKQQIRGGGGGLQKLRGAVATANCNDDDGNSQSPGIL